MGKIKLYKYFQVMSWFVLAASMLLNSGCSIFVTKETNVIPDEGNGTRTTENVEVGTDIEAPAGDVD